MWQKKSKRDSTDFKARIRLLVCGALLILIFFVFYHYTISTFLSLYASGYSNMPRYMKVVNFLHIQFSALLNPSTVHYSHSLLIYVFILGSFTIFFGFGLTQFRNLALTLIFISPWVFNILIIHNLILGMLDLHYYSYIVGGAEVAAILGFLILSHNKSNFEFIASIGTTGKS